MSLPASEITVAILCGGLGTRLGALTHVTPKPLLPVGGMPFLDHLLLEIGRFGFRRIVLLAHFQPEAMQAFARQSVAAARFGLELSVSDEPEAAGTGGALHHARGMLSDPFLMLNGDTWLEINHHALLSRLTESGAVAALGLRAVANPDRYNTAELTDGMIGRFARDRSAKGLGLINGGVAACSGALLERLPAKGSIEDLVWPALATEGRLAGVATAGYFLDIGVPEAFALAQTAIPGQHTRGAVFFDRDGVLNLDRGHVGSVDRFDWVEGAREAVRLVNESGHYAFVVTNQAGVAKGLYGEAEVDALHAHIQCELNVSGAHIDAFRYCPYHIEGTVAAYARDSDWRKPKPGMILDLMREWPVDPARSLLIGDTDSDLAAARAAGIAGRKYTSGSLRAFVASALADIPGASD